MRSRDASILMVPGLGNSGPDHWQTRWQTKLPTARRVDQASWDAPERFLWAEAVHAAIVASDRPVIIIAHSLGVIATVDALTSRDVQNVAGAFLVAPPEEERLLALPQVDPAFALFPSAPLPCPSVLVASRNDPYASLASSENLALDWGSKMIDAGEAGHINSESGHGPWPEGLMAFAGFLNKL
ncbi:MULTISPECIES: RBBP9/YdeN family alpha/beta hydrolase [Lichenihabitans]|uniref:RBBP9/YdeN family alpha/beta hydrolase n=1 Tax=Lichenihabitans TaxID=2723776 RepID=UPI00103660E5|nr:MULTISPECIES: alpha/beta hydrolase [Lichenihabitans]UDL95958.1 alpha/beta hydrolase [Lichenihabitans sp. PAMC28606]